MMAIQHLCRRWGDKQDPAELRRRKRKVIHALRPYCKHWHPDVRVWVEVIMFAVHDLYEDAPHHILDDTNGRTRACSDPLYFFDGRLRNHCDIIGCFSAPHVLRLMKDANLFPESVWERVSF